MKGYSTIKTTSSKAHLKIFLNTFIILWIHLLFYYEYKYLNDVRVEIPFNPSII